MNRAAAGDRPPLVGVLGGMGPLATVDFLAKLVEETPATRDQEHVPTVVWSVPQVPDRQQALAGTGSSPLPAMLAGIARLNAAGATRIAIACNTAHHWFDALAAASEAPLIHIVDATLAALGPVPAAGPVGLIATRGLVASGLYQRRLGAAGLAVITSTDDEFDTLFTPGCYAVKRNALAEGGALLAQACGRLRARGAGRLVLACTEVPVALAHVHSPLLADAIDCNRALARACVDYWLGRRG